MTCDCEPFQSCKTCGEHKFILDVTPVPKPRMTRADRWKKRPCVLRYFEFADKMKLRSKQVGCELGHVLSCTFIIPMPKSWSKKKRAEMDGKPHQQRPDLDNLLKALKDSLLDEDCVVWKYEEIEKRWGDLGKIIIKEKTCFH